MEAITEDAETELKKTISEENQKKDDVIVSLESKF